MTERRFKYYMFDGFEDNGKEMSPQEVEETLNRFQESSIEDYKKIKQLETENKKFKVENEHLQKELKRCKNWINSDKYDYELTLAFIKNKGYSLKDVLEYEKELSE